MVNSSCLLRKFFSVCLGGQERCAARESALERELQAKLATMMQVNDKMSNRCCANTNVLKTLPRCRSYSACLCAHVLCTKGVPHAPMVDIRRNQRRHLRVTRRGVWHKWMRRNAHVLQGWRRWVGVSCTHCTALSHVAWCIGPMPRRESELTQSMP